MLISFIFSEYDIDGATLKLMDNVQRISIVIPKFKYQLIFLQEREKLFQQNFDFSTECISLTPIRSTNSEPPPPSSSSLFPTDSESLSTIPKNSQSQTTTARESHIVNQTTDNFDGNKKIEDNYLDEYVIPALPKDLIEDIEAGALHKFGPHFRNRQILIDTICSDLIERYKILLVRF